MLYKIAISQVGWDAPSRGMGLIDQHCLFQSGQFMSNSCRTEIKPVLPYQRLGCNWSSCMNIFLNKSTQYLLFAFAQRCHLFFSRTFPNTSLASVYAGMIHGLSSVIASSL